MHVPAQGTGQTLLTAARNDADLVLVHDPEAEQKFIAGLCWLHIFSPL